MTFEEVQHAVDSSDKKRFALLYIPSAHTTESTAKATTVPTAIAGSDLSTEEATAEGQPSTGLSGTVLEAPTTSEDQNTETEHALSVKDSDPSHFLIRATQGHSMKGVEAASYLEPLSLADESKLPETVVHGTFYGSWNAILQSGGLRGMGRNQIHFATGPTLESVLAAQEEVKAQQQQPPNKSDTAVISGMRWDAQVLIYIDLRKALAAGCPFWRSENGVILSEGLPVATGCDDANGDQQKILSVDFFDVVVERRAGLGKLWERGETLQELPAHLAKKGIPRGKQR